MMHERRARTSIALIVGVLLLGCGPATDETASGAATPELLAGHVLIPETGTPGGQGETEVTVLETMNAGGYTYARIKVEGEDEDAWLAGPQAVLSVGEVLVVLEAIPMEDFTSPSLNRTFDLLYFVGSFQRPGEPLAGPVAEPQSTVDEVLTGGGYTYVRVVVEGDELWLAGPRVAVSEGQTITWRGGAPMDGFRSSTLDRSFEKILFVDAISVIP